MVMTAEILRDARDDAEPDIAHARARLVIDSFGRPIGMLLVPMRNLKTEIELRSPRRPLRSAFVEGRHRSDQIKRAVSLKPQIVLAEEPEGKVEGYIWRVASGNIAALMDQSPRIFQSLARYFGPPGTEA